MGNMKPASLINQMVDCCVCCCAIMRPRMPRWMSDHLYACACRAASDVCGIAGVFAASHHGSFALVRCIHFTGTIYYTIFTVGGQQQSISGHCVCVYYFMRRDAEIAPHRAAPPSFVSYRDNRLEELFIRDQRMPPLAMQCTHTHIYSVTENIVRLSSYYRSAIGICAHCHIAQAYSCVGSKGYNITNRNSIVSFGLFPVISLFAN